MSVFDLKSLLIRMYREGHEIEEITDELQYYVEDFSEEDTLQKLKEYVKENKKNKTTYKDEIKIVIAERFSNGIKKKNISKELGILPNTIGRFCEKFGTKNMKNANVAEEQLYTKVGEANHIHDACPLCGSLRFNVIEMSGENNPKSKYCIDCGNEILYEVKDDETFEYKKLNFELL